MTTEFLEGHHGAARLTPVDQQRVVQEATGHQIAQSAQVFAGYDNEVHRMVLDNDSVVFFRSQANDGDFSGEVHAMNLARGNGAPVPEVWWSGHVRTRQGAVAVMLLESAPGVRLAETIGTLDRLAREHVLDSLGRVVEAIGDIPMPGPWRPDADGTWPDSKLLADRFTRNRMRERPLLVAAGLEGHDLEIVLSLVGRSVDTPARSDFRLCHGDLTPDHIFVDDELNVVGLIDWGMWHAGSALEDFACVATWAAESRDLPRLFGHEAGPEIERRIAASQVNQLVGQLAYHQSIGDGTGVTAVLRPLLRAAHAHHALGSEESQ